MAKVDLSNTQGIVLELFRYPISRHLLFHFGDPAGSRAFLSALIPQLTTADLDLDANPEPLLSIGLTYTGLEALGASDQLLAEFDASFIAGPNPEAFGDVAGSRSDPITWWEGQFSTQDLHCIVHLYCQTDAAVASASANLRASAQRCGVHELVPRKDGTVLDGRSIGAGKLHFGYTDGISHPDIYWDDADATPAGLDFRNFVLGYATDAVSSAPTTGLAAQIVRDSSYAVFRWLYQDVATFNRFLSTEAPKLAPNLPLSEAQELLAAKMMGRWRDGTPLVLSPDKPDAGLARSNDFAYAAQDSQGHSCPFSAHIRVVNPRDQPLDPVVMGVPRLLRRGMPYGPPLISTEDDGQDRGLIGIFICSDILRQIYTLMGWIKQNSFSPVFDANRRVQDALVANRHVAGTIPEFIIPATTGPVTLTGLPDFVHTKGTALVLLPSKSALHHLVGDT